MTQEIDAATAHAWTALGGARESAEHVTYVTAPGVLPARLPVRQLARASVGVCSLAAAELAARRSGGGTPEVRVYEAAVGAAFVSERLLRIDGRSLSPFAPLSSFFPAADGWVRTHANYPHHRARLLSALGIPGGEDDDTLRERLARELRARPARSIQDTVYAAGGLAVEVAAPGTEPGAEPGTEPAAERGTESGTRRRPLIESRRVGAGDGGGFPAGRGPRGGSGRRLSDGAGSLPAHGVRVLDLTRVIAGPVATRTLGLLGADVLRVDPPGLPEDPKAHADTGFGKRSTRLELGDPADRAVFGDLLASADVVILGYRAGSLERYGLTPGALLARYPGLIVAELNAWGWTGPWRERRGFDSLVQAATGIALVQREADGPSPDGRPGTLPAQALDHSTGYLLAAAILRALTEREDDGAGRHLRLSLTGTASWLTDGVRPEPEAADEGTEDPGAWLAETPSPYGRLRYVLPPVAYEGGPRDWPGPPSLWGTDAARWL
ncbi:CoA transferase [Streptomyces sp. NBC_01498]|nr:CoA transferase [Streptomyces sp. NBC_01498]WTL27222.1 CoA transferase [Streptomyces sp. NBC_01498]